MPQEESKQTTGAQMVSDYDDEYEEDFDDTPKEPVRKTAVKHETDDKKIENLLRTATAEQLDTLKQSMSHWNEPSKM